MSQYNLTLSGIQPIDFAPATTEAELRQNLFTLLTTWRGSVVLNRRFGFDPGALDEPTEVSKALITSQIYELVGEYEPRILIQEIQFVDLLDDPDNGRLIPVIYFEEQEVSDE
ncbi:GPW/gp25 family protein [Paenibacillus farraposensis]|uniref:GPW/gp25 family protein n=1 Tax=Paenibacillus farraposensis TaxID=2807095 RepID=A0ABW4DC90_9BACL|nr:GPW/gp25 family protein [Paenibacillus farraposensis]MCC3379892.1 GPW/gp25 family protein [Paenibacillus farraposensis]